MTLADILKKQRYQRYKSLIFLVSIENSDFKRIEKVFKNQEYDLIDIYQEIKNEKLDFKKFTEKKLEYLKEYFNKKDISGKLMVINNIEILMSILDEEELKNCINQLAFDNYIDMKKTQTIFLLPDILRYRRIEMKNEDDKSSRVYKIENIKI